MKKKLIWRNSVIIALAVLLMGCISLVLSAGIINKQNKESILEFANLLQTGLELDDPDGYGKYVNLPDNSKIRLTIINMDGTVLADSNFEPEGLDNHLGREEVRAALNGESVFITRKSGTAGGTHLYYARIFGNADNYLILRISRETADFTSYVQYLIPIMIATIAAMITVSFMVTYKINKSVVSSFETVATSLRLLNSGKYKHTMPVYHDDDLNRVFNEINEIQETLNATITGLYSEKDKLAHILSELDSGVILIDESFSVVLVNKCIDRMFDKKVKAESSAAMLPLSDAAINGVLSVKNGAEKFRIEEKIGEQTYYVRVSKTGELIVMTFSDISDIKKYNEMRSEFFANASHELKTPVTSIVGFSELLEGAQNDDSRIKYADRISAHSRRLLQLVNDMLEISRLESGDTAKGGAELLDVNSIITDVIADYDYMARDKQVGVTLEGSAKLYAEKKDIEDVAGNLIANAINYNKKGGCVKVTLSNVDDGALICVKDDGIGIRESEINRIFERFYRTDKGRSRRNGGTGLGLAIVKHIAEKYSGDIGVVSALNKGSTFSVTLHNLKK